MRRATVGPAGDLDDEVERRLDLGPHRGEGQGDVAHEHHRLQPAEGVVGAVGVAGGQRPLVAGVHGLEHVERLGAPDLAHDDAVGPHAQGVAHQVADAHLARALGVGRPGLQPHHVLAREAQLGRVLDGDDPLAAGDAPGEGVEQGGLAGPRAARHQDVEAGRHRPGQEGDDRRRGEVGRGGWPGPRSGGR